MEKVFFKIVVPNFNNMPYIKACLDSILSQQFKNYKVIIVDDSSTDLSDQFCEMYARLHPDKIVFLRAQEKLYAGGCRNVGIKYPLECEYYLFVDADDYYYDRNSLGLIHSFIQFSKEPPPIVIYDYYRLIRDQLQLFKIGNPAQFKHRLANSPFGSPWSKAIRSDVIKPFLEKCCHGEDTYQLLTMADELQDFSCVAKLNAPIYVYNRQNPTGTINLQTAYLETKPVFYNAIRELRKNAKTDFVRDSIDFRLQHQL